MSIKGSKVTEQGKAVTACSEHRMLAVVPASKLDFTPLRLKLAITSDYDGRSPDHEAQGWFAFQGFLDIMRARRVAHTAQLVVKMKFDPNTAWPKVMFSPDRFLTEAEVKTLLPVIKTPEVTSLLDGSWTPAGIDGVKTGLVPVEDAPAPVPVKAAVPARAAAPVAEDDDDSGELELPGVVQTAPAKPAATPKVVSAAPAKPTVAPAKAAPVKAVSAPTKAPERTVDDDAALNDLLKDWDA